MIQRSNHLALKRYRIMLMNIFHLATYILQEFQKYPIVISRLARGISAGASIEFASEIIITDALNERKTLN